jgi:hypothetical protein
MILWRPIPHPGNKLLGDGLSLIVKLLFILNRLYVKCYRRIQIKLADPRINNMGMHCICLHSTEHIMKLSVVHIYLNTPCDQC